MKETSSRVWLKQGFCFSWLDPTGGLILSRRLEKRLIKRASVARKQKQPGLFITLTYDRKAWESPEHLWNEAAEHRHVPHFLKRLKRAMKHKAKFSWVCKKEFQEGGWLHYHLILYGLDYIEFETLREAWGFGHVYAQRVSRRRIGYLAKYNAKFGEYPQWLYQREARSVKIISVSQGFWKPSEGDKQVDKRLTESRRPLDEMRVQGCSDGLTLAERIEEARSFVVCKDSAGKWTKLEGDVNRIYAGMYLHGHRCTGRSYGGLSYAADLADVQLAQMAYEAYERRLQGFSDEYEAYAQQLQYEATDSDRLAAVAANGPTYGGVSLFHYQNSGVKTKQDVAPF